VNCFNVLGLQILMWRRRKTVRVDKMVSTGRIITEKRPQIETEIPSEQEQLTQHQMQGDVSVANIWSVRRDDVWDKPNKRRQSKEYSGSNDL